MCRTRMRRQSEVPRHARCDTGEQPAFGSADYGAHGGIRRPRCRAQAHAASHFRKRDARSKADVLRPLLADGANADFDVVMLSPDGKALAKNGVRYDLLKVESSYQWYRQNGQWEFEPVKTNGKSRERHGGYCR